jgi:hypothetical protein
MDEPGSLTLERSAGLVGGYCWMERRLFALTGAWANRAGTAASLQVHFDVMSAQHAWHAELFFDRLPVLDWVDRPSLVVAPSPGVRQLFSDLDDPAMAPAVRLGVLATVVLPRLVATYDRHLGYARPVADQPVMRALGLVLADERSEIDAARMLVGDGASAGAALTTACEAFEALTRAEGASGGLVAWPEGPGEIQRSP